MQLERKRRQLAKAFVFLASLWAPFFCQKSNAALEQSQDRYTLGLQSFGYLGTAQLASEGKNVVLPGVFGSVKWSDVGEQFEGAVKAEGFLSATGIENSYVLVEELYLASSRKWNPNQFSIGRRLFSYSDIDEDWQIGLFQTRGRWDHFNPRQQGLSGFFYSRKIKNLQYSIYFSPLFIPEQASDCNVNNETGEIQCSNPFDKLPPTEKGVTEGDSNALPIRYSLNTSDIIDEVIVKAGGGGRLRIGGEQGVYSRAAYAYKPVNQVLISYDPYTEASSEKALQVQLYPRVLYHHAFAWDLGYQESSWKLWTGTLGDFVVQDETVPIHVNQEISDSVFFSVGGQRTFYGVGFGSITLEGSYLKRVGGVEPDSGDLTTGRHSLFETRFQFTEAVKASLRFQNRKGRDFLKLSASYDFPIQGTLLSAEWSYQPRDAWRIFLGGELVGVGPTGDGDLFESGGTNWFARIRGTDRIRGGVTYAF